MRPLTFIRDADVRLIRSSGCGVPMTKSVGLLEIMLPLWIIRNCAVVR